MDLQTEVRELVKKYGPELGDLYFESDVAWDQILKKVRAIEESKINEQQSESIQPPSISSSNEEIRLHAEVEVNPSTVGFSDFSVSPVDDDEEVIIDQISSESEALLNKKTN